MERLTYFKNGHWRVNFDGCQYNARFVDRLAAYENTGLMPGEVAELQALLQGCESKKSAEWVRLQELAEADKAGRVMVLPCEIGTAIYYIHYPIAFYPDESEPEIKRGIFTLIDLDRFGHSVFLTREEAEKKWKEVQKDNGKSKLD